MEPQLVLVRIAAQSQSSSNRLNPLSRPQTVEVNHFTGVAKWDVNHPYHLAMSERKGILQTYKLETTEEGSKPYLYPCGSFQLHLDFESSCQESEASHGIKINNTNSNDRGIASLCFGPGGKQRERKARANLIEQTWGSFEFIPGRAREIIFFQDGSTRILFARLPGGSPRSPKFGETSMARIDSRKSKVYCVGRHSSTILSIAVRGDGLALVSAARDGYIRIWRISDGSMLAQTMFSRWRQPRSPRHGKGTKSPFSRDTSEFEMDKMSSSMQVLSFLSNSSDLYMGCPNGEVRIWSMTECESNRLTIAEVGNSTVGKDVISSLALHVPNCNFPVQCNAGDNQSCSNSPKADTEFLAIGTINQNLQVWTKQTTANEWLPLWSTTLSIEGAAIGSLYFRADGGLLAVSASRSGKHIACNDPLNNSSKSSSRNHKQSCDRLYIYNTSSWECEGWLSFTSHLGSCLFYCPRFTVEDKNDPRSSASQVKVSACRLLLVSTSSGPQTHILPEYGLFGSIHDQSEQHKLTQLDWRKEATNMHRGDPKRGVLRQCFKKKETQEFPEVEGEGDGSGDCYPSSPVPVNLEIDRETGPCFSGQDFDTDEKSPKHIIDGPLRMRELLDEQTGLQSLRQAVSQDRKSQRQSNPHKIKTKTHPRKSSFKGQTSNLRGLASSLLPRDHAIKKHRCKKQLPVSFVNQTCKICEEKSPRLGFEKQQNTASSSNSLFPLTPSPPSLHPHRGQETGTENSFMEANIAKVEESYIRTTMDTTTVDQQNVGTKTPQELPCKTEEKVLNPKVKKEVTFTKTPEVIPGHNVGKTASSGATNSHSRKKGGKGRLGGVSRTKTKSWDSKKENRKTLGQNKLPNQQRTGKEQRRDLISSTQSRHRILGGEVLQELLVMNEENSPFKDKVQMGATFRANPLPMSLVVKPTVDSSKISEEKPGPGLHRPVAFSTASLMQKLQAIEDEKFDLDATIQVAKAKGIVLSKYDREQIKAALEEKGNTGSSKCEAGLEGRKPPARYIPLLKIPDPRVSYNGPFVAPRKVRKQSDVKGEDMRTIQPALFDLWDLNEGCPQVSSANLEQGNTFSVTSWRRALGNLNETNKNSVWVQREDVCRGATCAQAVYHNCLYGPNLEPQCHCYEEQENSNIHFK